MGTTRVKAFLFSVNIIFGLLINRTFFLFFDQMWLYVMERSIHLLNFYVFSIIIDDHWYLKRCISPFCYSITIKSIVYKTLYRQTYSLLSLSSNAWFVLFFFNWFLWFFFSITSPTKNQTSAAQSLLNYQNFNYYTANFNYNATVNTSNNSKSPLISNSTNSAIYKLARIINQTTKTTINSNLANANTGGMVLSADDTTRRLSWERSIKHI